MTAEREIAGFVLPFTLGVALATFAQRADCETSIYILSASLFLVSTCLLPLSHNAHNKLGDNTLWALIIITGLCSGVLCHKCDSFYLTSVQTDRIWTLETATDFCQKMKSEIASITFENRQTNAIATALITGDRSGLNTDTLEAFRKSGASHILALSGMHLGIIYGLLKFLLKVFGNTRSARAFRSGILVLSCGFYALSTGAGASIVRAFLFILIAEIADISGRRNSLKTIVFSSLLIHLIVTPGEIKSVGFQLSYAAVGGIAFFYPWLVKLWPDDRQNQGWTNKILKWVWNCSALSIACQITTGPIAYIYFGTFPKYFLITNLLSLPLTALIIPASLITLALSAADICPDFAIHITENLINLLLYCLTTIASL